MADPQGTNYNVTTANTLDSTDSTKAVVQPFLRLRQIREDIGDVDGTSLPQGATVYNGQTYVTTAGTQGALASSQAITHSVTIMAQASNSGNIFIGNSSVSSTNGYILDAGDTIELQIANLATVYVDSSVNGEGVHYIAT